jgi:hypothetical protein
MITSIDFNEEPLQAGEQRILLAWSNTQPLFVEIKCFREPPTPPELRACSECGSFRVSSGEAVTISASLSVFAKSAGYLLVRVTDASRDSREFRLEISNDAGSSSSYTEGGLYA